MGEVRCDEVPLTASPCHGPCEGPLKRSLSEEGTLTKSLRQEFQGPRAKGFPRQGPVAGSLEQRALGHGHRHTEDKVPRDEVPGDPVPLTRSLIRGSRLLGNAL